MRKKDKEETPSASYDVDSEGFPVLKGELFWQWKASIEMVQRIDSDLKLKSMEVDLLFEKFPDIKKAINERSSLVQQSVNVRQEYNKVIEKLEKHFGFSMRSASIDDYSGRVHVINVENDSAGAVVESTVMDAPQDGEPPKKRRGRKKLNP